MDDDTDLPVPFHDDCKQLLMRYLHVQTLEPEALLGTFRQLAPTWNLDYGEDMWRGQTWEVRRGFEYTVFSPLNIPELESYYHNLPRVDQEELAEPVLFEDASRPPTQDDPFHMLPSETMQQIMCYLPLETVHNLRRVSKVAHNVALGNSFWKARVLRDMDYLFDLPDSIKEIKTVHWKQVFDHVDSVSQHPCSKIESDSELMHGLANRRRIWELVLPRISDIYLALMKEPKSQRQEKGRSRSEAVRQSDEVADAQEIIQVGANSNPSESTAIWIPYSLIASLVVVTAAVLLRRYLNG